MGGGGLWLVGSWAVVRAARGSVVFVRCGLRESRSDGRTVRGNDWNDEVVAVVEGGEGRQERVSSVGEAIALGAAELCAELSCPSGSCSGREDVVLGLAFGRVSENVAVAATLEGAVAGRGGVD